MKRALIPVLLITLLAGVWVAACTVNPATGKRQLSLISEAQEIEIGRENDRQVIAAMGLVDDPELQDYVDRLGQTLAAQSERPDLPWTFRVVDDPTVNAFALPGGFIYVTRGILSYFNSEAELVGVLGHEIGHVTGRHSVERLSKAQLTQIGLGVGMILEPELQQYGDLAQTGLGVLFLKFSRDDERQADDLGLRYVRRTNYDPQEFIDVFEMLGRVSATQSEGGRLPGWLSTHPAPENRVERIAQQIGSEPAGLSNPVVARERYLQQIDGMVFGENPREGFFENGTFYHPELAFALEFPRGWKTQNTRQAVAALSPNQDAVVVLTLSDEQDVRSAEATFFSQTGVQAGRDVEPRYSGLAARSRAFSVSQGQSGRSLEGLVSFVEHGDNVYQILGYTLDSRVRTYQEPITDAVWSFRRVRDRSILNVQPKRIEIVDIPRAMTLRQFADRYPSTVDLDTLVLINEMESANQRLARGTTVKRVVGGRS